MRSCFKLMCKYALQVHVEMVNLHDTLHHFAVKEEEWTYLQELCDILKPFANATIMVSKESCPSAGLAFAIFEDIMRKLGNSIVQIFVKSHYLYLFIEGNLKKDISCVSKNMAKAAWLKMRKWYTAMDMDILAVAAVLDPRIKIHYFEKVLKWPKSWVRQLLQKV